MSTSLHSLLRPLAAALLTLSVTSHAAPPAAREVTLDRAAASKPMDRFFDLSVGADYPGTTGRPENTVQLGTAVDELGFRYVRFHDIFHDKLGTVRLVDGHISYDFSGIDKLYDDLLARGIKPFIELGFTPAALKTSEQTIFYWKGNTSHPQPGPWSELIEAFARHLIQRYGAHEVRQWPFEVWNEPNLAGFFEGGKAEDYFGLYAITARALKRVDPALLVGGPSTAGAAWVPEFLTYCKANNVPVDFVTTHTYGVTEGFLDEFSKRTDKILAVDPNSIIGDVRRNRQEIEASAYPRLPLYVTEWSTSYSPRDKVHDSYVSAPWMLTKLRATRGHAQAMSYWTYSDLFEEPGPPDAPFHGGFGLMTREGIRKPVWFAYRYLAALQGKEIPTSDSFTWAATDGQQVQALVWDWRNTGQKLSNRSFFGKPRPSHDVGTATVEVRHLPPGRWQLTQRRTGFEVNDAHTAYLKMGSPKNLDAKQLAELQALTTDQPDVQREVKVGADGRATVTLTLRSHDVVLLSLKKVAA